MAELAELLVVGGRSGVGKSAVAFEVSAQLAESEVSHALIEGDVLDFAYPPPEGPQLAEKNLATLWSNYRDLGHRRLIYTNTASVLYADRIAAAMSGQVRIMGILLACSDKTAGERLALREVGSKLSEHIERGRQASIRLEESAPASVVRIDTDEMSVVSIATQVIGLSGWMS
jgi:cytidylate kinase